MYCSCHCMASNASRSYGYAQKVKQFRYLYLGRSLQQQPDRPTSQCRPQHLLPLYVPFRYHNFSTQTPSTSSTSDVEALNTSVGKHNFSAQTPSTSSASDIEETVESREFQAETNMLLDIVAKSLYSDKEVFLRELISNASDALQKLRYMHLTQNITDDIGALEIKICTNKQERTLTIEDNGIGMTREDLIKNLGTIAKSGSKEFLEELKNKGVGSTASSVIGQFGVGFYSVFMVADRIEVLTKAHSADSPVFKWSSDGSGSYTIQEVISGSRGTKIVIFLKPNCREFCDEIRVKDIVKKYSNFVSVPIMINGVQANTIQPIWVMEPKTVTAEMHHEFYRFISNSFDKPRFFLHFRTDVPLSVQAVLYFPEGKPGLFEMSKDSSVGVSLYTKRVLIKSHAENIIPKWLRFVRGVVDSEDIALNLSRELLQNSALISKLRTLVTNKVLRYLNKISVTCIAEYDKFYEDYSIYLKEGIVSSDDLILKEEIGKLLKYESTATARGTHTSLPEYCKRLQPGQNEIFYLAAPSRQLAETSPYLEALKEKKVEILFCFQPHDELVMMHLRSFNNYKLVSVEAEMLKESSASDELCLDSGSLSRDDANNLISWLEETFKNRIHSVRMTKKLHAHPCVITVLEMAAARHFMRTQAHLLKDNMKFSLLQPRLEVNPSHPLIKKLSELTKTKPELALLVAEQLHSNALIVAGLLEDPRTVLQNMNKLLELALVDH